MKLEVNCSVLPEQADQSLTFSTSDKDVASVSKGGIVRARGEGTARITATANNGIKEECVVTVSVPDNIAMSQQDGIQISMQQEQLIIFGCSVNQNVSLYTITGQLVERNKADANGYVVFDVSAHKNGMCIIKVGNETFKILNK